MPAIDFSQILVPSVNLLGIVLRTFIVYLVVVLGLRVFGKRELGQMTPFDLVLILTLSNSVQNAMTGPDSSLTGGIVSAGTLLATNWLIAKLEDRIPWLREVLVGNPTQLIKDGKLIPEAMNKEGIDKDELLQAAREHGINSLSNVQEAVLEVDGTISIVEKGGGAHTLRRRRRRYRKLP